jgi:hypothetical protein
MFLPLTVELVAIVANPFERSLHGWVLLLSRCASRLGMTHAASEINVVFVVDRRSHPSLGLIDHKSVLCIGSMMALAGADGLISGHPVAASRLGSTTRAASEINVDFVVDRRSHPSLGLVDHKYVLCIGSRMALAGINGLIAEHHRRSSPGCQTFGETARIRK